MRKLKIVALLLFAFSANAFACSCAGTHSIEDAIENRPNLIEGKVIGLDKRNNHRYGTLVFGATLQVTKVLKGAVYTSEIYVSLDGCYASIYPSVMHLGHTYILPLESENTAGRYGLATCSHSGLELIDGKLYTSEVTKGGGRQLKFYMTREEFLRRLTGDGLAPPGHLPPHKAR